MVDSIQQNSFQIQKRGSKDNIQAFGKFFIKISHQKMMKIQKENKVLASKG